MKSVIRVAISAGAIATVAGLAIPTASAATVGSAAAKCEHTKPILCIPKHGAIKKGKRWVQGVATLKTGGGLRGRVGISIRNPRDVNHGPKQYWSATVTLTKIAPVSSPKESCKKGYEAQAVWDSTPGKKGGNSYGPVFVC